jgi:hypothetical protein
LFTDRAFCIYPQSKRPYDWSPVFGVACLKEIERKRLYPAYDPFPACWADSVLIDPELSVAIPNSIDISFEEFYKTRWNQGLFRYLLDEIVRKILFRTKLEMQKIGCNQHELDKLEKLIGFL